MSSPDYIAVDQNELGKLDAATYKELHSRARKWSLSQIVLVLIGFAACLSLLVFGFLKQRGPKRYQITAGLLAPRLFFPDCENTIFSN